MGFYFLEKKLNLSYKKNKNLNKIFRDFIKAQFHNFFFNNTDNFISRLK